MREQNELADGLAEVVAVNEAVKMDDEELADLVTRLKQEQETDFQAGEDGAAAVGAKWAKRASLADLRKIVGPDDIDILDWDGRMSDDDFLALLDNYGAWGSRELEEECKQNRRDRDSYLAGFREGFEEGVLDIWNQVSGQL
jgi:hypothetical protein